LLSWRLWKFTIAPALYPDRVKELPYWIPILGHTLSFFLNAPAVVDAGIHMTRDTQEPFTIQLLGTKNYFITSPPDIAAAFRNTESLSFHRFLDFFVCCFGVRKNDVVALNNIMTHLDRGKPETIAYPASGLNMKDCIHWIYKRQLAVDKIEELWDVFFPAVMETSSWSNLRSRNDAVVSAETTSLPLRGLLESTLTIPITKMLFGTNLLATQPNLPTHIQGFIDGLWKLVYQYPKWIIPNVACDQEASMQALEQFTDAELENAQIEVSDASWLVRTLIQAQTKGGLQRRSNAALLSVIYLAALANVHATSYWLLCYILFSPSLKAAIRNEITPAYKSDTLDATYIAEKCPLLDSCFREVLRLHITSNTVRFVEAPTRVQDKVLEPGNQIMIPLRQLGHSDRIWGANHEGFDPERFIKDKSLASHTAYRPFGGGAWLCPGKKYAARQVLNYVAYLLYMYDINLPLVDRKPQPFPKNEHENLAFGVSIPKTGMDPIIEMRRR
ncbi:cytochrome P450, partial [Phaeosphaeriaceae sp. PMI808]